MNDFEIRKEIEDKMYNALQGIINEMYDEKFSEIYNPDDIEFKFYIKYEIDFPDVISSRIKQTLRKRPCSSIG